jgi:hypothetical protein
MIHADCSCFTSTRMVEPVFSPRLFSMQLVFSTSFFFNWSLPIISTIPVFFFYFLLGRVNIAVCILSGNE